MEFEFIQPRKTYYKNHTKKVGRGKSESRVSVIPVFVLERRRGRKEVLASIGGQPPKWYNYYQYRHWFNK